MNLFKKKDKPEICGYLDSRGLFHKNKHDRDMENARIEKSHIQDSFRRKIRNEQNHYFGMYDNDIYHRVIDQIISNGTIERLANTYLIYKKQLKEIDEKYK